MHYTDLHEVAQDRHDIVCRFSGSTLSRGRALAPVTLAFGDSDHDVLTLLDLKRVARIRPRQPTVSTIHVIALKTLTLGRASHDYLKTIFSGIECSRSMLEQIKSFRMLYRSLPREQTDQVVIVAITSVGPLHDIDASRSPVPAARSSCVQEYRTVSSPTW